MTKNLSLFQRRKLRQPQSHVNQATSRVLVTRISKNYMMLQCKRKIFTSIHRVTAVFQTNFVLTSLQHVRSKQYCILYHDQWSSANGRRFIQKNRAMYGLLLPRYPTAPPDAFVLAGELVHALFDRCHDLPLHAQHGGQHIPLGAAFLWLYFLHEKRVTHTHTSGESLVFS